MNRFLEIPPETVGGGIFDRFRNFDNCQSEVASDVISGIAVQYVGVDVCVKFGESRLNHSQDIRLPQFVKNERRTTPAYAGHVVTVKTVAVTVVALAICSRLKVTDDVIPNQDIETFLGYQDVNLYSWHYS